MHRDISIIWSKQSVTLPLVLQMLTNKICTQRLLSKILLITRETYDWQFAIDFWKVRIDYIREWDKSKGGTFERLFGLSKQGPL